jgi:hypothetical protein
MMSNTSSTEKTRGELGVVANGKQFLFLISSPCYDDHMDRFDCILKPNEDRGLTSHTEFFLFHIYIHIFKDFKSS